MNLKISEKFDFSTIWYIIYQKNEDWIRFVGWFCFFTTEKNLFKILPKNTERRFKEPASFVCTFRFGKMFPHFGKTKLTHKSNSVFTFLIDDISDCWENKIFTNFEIHNNAGLSFLQQTFLWRIKLFLVACSFWSISFVFF